MGGGGGGGGACPPALPPSLDPPMAMPWPTAPATLRRLTYQGVFSSVQPFVQLTYLSLYTRRHRCLRRFFQFSGNFPSASTIDEYLSGLTNELCIACNRHLNSNAIFSKPKVLIGNEVPLGKQANFPLLFPALLSDWQKISSCVCNENIDARKIRLTSIKIMIVLYLTINNVLS